MISHFTKTEQYNQIIDSIFKSSKANDFHDTVILLSKALIDTELTELERKIGTKNLCEYIKQNIGNFDKTDFANLKYILDNFLNLQIITNNAKEYNDLDLEKIKDGVYALNMLSSYIDEMRF